MKSNRVVVAMSGGVDSSVAAAILKKEGYEVIGLSLKFWGNENRCCSDKDLHDARLVAQHLGIPHYVVSMKEVFKKEVVDYFVSEYLQGRTPNPCVVCNRKIKFGAMLRKADEFNARFLATGHYAIVERSDEYKINVLKRGKERRKDQSYFLARLSKAALQRALFPLGSYSKAEIRVLARKADLFVHEKKESQEVCFIPDGDIVSFNQKQRRGDLSEGPVIDEKGQRLGSHSGISGFTIGQRKGLGIAMEKPVYVIRIDAESNTIVVGDSEKLFKSCFVASDTHWIDEEEIRDSLRVKVKIRYKHCPQWASVSPLWGDRIKVQFDQPQRAIAPGQLAVFYDEEIVKGSAWIEYVVK